MKYFNIVLLFLLLGILKISAQNRKTYVVKAGEIPVDVLPPEAVYTFSEFKRGIVYMRDGTATNQQLNYNMALDEMHFLGSAKDTLAIAQPEMLKYIAIDTIRFYYDKNFIQSVYQQNDNTIGIRQYLVQSPYQTRGAYDMGSSVSSISTYSSTFFNGHISRLQIKKDVVLEKKSTLYIGNRFNHFYRADKKAFYQIFPSNKNQIEAFLKMTSIDFFKKDDLITLLQYCNSIN